jgi:geranylgeranyl diphosphate synthase, type II
MEAQDRNQWLKEALRTYHQLTLETLLSYLPDKEPHRYLYDLIAYYPNRPGKGFRPALCIATCKAFGGGSRQVLRTAAALELFHNAFLVHDDIEDASEFRRGSPTLHAEHGVPIAVNVGDAMNVLGIRPLMENLVDLGPRLTWRIFAEIEHMVRQSVEGQAMEVGWVHENVCDLDGADYLRMTLKKTCWYTCIHPCRIGALVAAGDGIDLGRFNRFGYYMGAAFQIQDDVLNLVGEHGKYGKEIGGDIWEGKRTMMLIHALNHSSKPENGDFRAFLSKPRAQRTADEVAWVYGIMDKYGSIDYARSCAKHLAGAALREFFVAYGDQADSEDKEMIRTIILYMIERDL